jgi:PAS domain S-box-containing protein
MVSINRKYNIDFVSIPGEMAALTQEKDWSQTSIGAFKDWPQCLTILVGIVLNSRFPMVLFWGKELISFYNDAFRPSLGQNGKHPHMLGMRAEEAWTEIWDIIQPLFDQVLSGKGAIWSEDQLIPIFRNGKIEDVYWTFSYSPVNGDTGKIDGLLVTCTETTEKVITKKKLEESERRLRSMILQAPVSIGIFQGRDYITEIANSRALQMWGKTEEEVLNKPILEAMQELKSQGIKELLDEVYNTGRVFSASELPIQMLRNGKLETAYVNFSYEPLYNPNGEVDRIMAVGSEVTAQVMAHKKIEASEEFNRMVLENSPDCLSILDNEGRLQYMNLNGLSQMEIDDFSLFKSRYYWDLWGIENEHVAKDVFNKVLTGKTAQFTAFCPTSKGTSKWWDVIVSSVEKKGEGIQQIISVSRDITEQKNIDLKTLDNERKLNIVLEASQLGVYELDMQTDMVSCSERFREIFGYANDEKLSHTSFINRLLPEDKTIRDNAFNRALETGSLIYKSRILLPDKSIRWIEISGKISYDEKNKPTRLIGTCRDITEEKQFRTAIEESEKKFRLLADSMPQHIWTADPKGNLNYFNESVFNYSGLTREQLDKDGWIQIVHPDDREGNVKKWNESITSGEDFVFEHRFRRHDGEYRWQLSRAIPQRNERGAIQMWVGTSTDIQEQKKFGQELERQVTERTAELEKLNKSLKKSEERYHLMVEEVQDYAILYLNCDGIVENWNAGAERIKGYKAGEIIGKNFANFYTLEDRQNGLPKKLLSVAVRENKAVQEGWRVRKDQTLFWASVVITALHNENGEVIGFSKVTHDLTEKKEADDTLRKQKLELEQKNAELEKINKELQSFAYISSHDLQEPLRKIQTFASRIIEKEKDNLSETGRDLFGRMQKAAERMQSLINDLLAYSRTHTLEKDFELLNLEAIIQKVRQDLKEEIEQKHATINILGTCDLRVIPFQFQQLFFNLINNSLKFSNPKKALTITINSKYAPGGKLEKKNLQPETNYCHIIVSDNGIGFEPQYNEKIFELFQRLHGKNEFPGTGIGLAIVKRIVENHNGIITANGKEGEGATFDIYIPEYGKSVN